MGRGGGGGGQQVEESAVLRGAKGKPDFFGLFVLFSVGRFLLGSQKMANCCCYCFAFVCSGKRVEERTKLLGKEQKVTSNFFFSAGERRK